MPTALVRTSSSGFDSSMDRVSGRYKRRTQLIVFTIGMVIAGVANIDSVKIVRVLSTDAGVCDALVAQSKAAAPARPKDATVEELRELGLPLGWDHETLPFAYWWLMKLLGILTSLAVSLGAPVCRSVDQVHRGSLDRQTDREKPRRKTSRNR